MGINSFELGSHEFIRNSKNLSMWNEQLERHKLKVSAIYDFGHFSNWSKRREIYIHHELMGLQLSNANIKNVVLGPGIRFKKTWEKEDQERMIKMISEISKRYKHYGIKMGIHPHYAHCIFNKHEIDYVMDKTKDVYLVPDIEHLFEAYIDERDFIKEYISRILCIHVKDVKVQTYSNPLKEGIFKKGKSCNLGKGDMDLQGFFSLLTQLKYDKWITIEIDKPTYGPEIDIKESLDFVKGIW
ncbi:sugar phosphate isomerase/epimerase [Cytobacillus oceanisediminis]|nr:sugar phosphate isomerase/epimerase [Cytobacillus oceanisediminis]